MSQWQSNIVLVRNEDADKVSMELERVRNTEKYGCDVREPEKFWKNEHYSAFHFMCNGNNPWCPWMGCEMKINPVLVGENYLCEPITLIEKYSREHGLYLKCTRLSIYYYLKNLLDYEDNIEITTLIELL